MSCCYCLPRAHCLRPDEQLFLKGCTTQEVKPTVGAIGGGVFCVGPCFEGRKRTGITLQANEYLKIRNIITGEVKVVKGPYYYFFDAYEEESRLLNGTFLGPTEFLRVEEELTGEIRIEKGPQVFIPGPHDRFGNKEDAIPLRHNQYLKILDKRTGEVRVEVGEQLIFFKPTEFPVEPGVKNGVNIDEHTAVLVRSTETGQLRLEMGKKMFIPKAKEEVEEVRKKVVLEDNQVAILKTKDGKYMFKAGKDAGVEDDPELAEYDTNTGESSKRAFFVPPFCELVRLEWFQGDGVDCNEIFVSIFDMRPSFMNYDFTCRTCDNVELKLTLSLFWQIGDIRRMIARTGDLPTAICIHVRSTTVTSVSRLTFEKFLANFNQIVSQEALKEDDDFYQDRGAILHSVEVTGLHCVDPDVENVLREIIKETTNRLNKLQHQASDNEVRISKLRGDIELEKENGNLLKLRKDHQKMESRIEGQRQSTKISAFLKSLDEVKVPFDVEVQMWETLQKMESLNTVASGNSTLYFTPKDVNLSIETLSAPMGKKK